MLLVYYLIGVDHELNYVIVVAEFNSLFRLCLMSALWLSYTKCGKDELACAYAFWIAFLIDLDGEAHAATTASENPMNCELGV